MAESDSSDRHISVGGYDMDPVFLMGHDPNKAMMCLILKLPSDPAVVGIMLADALNNFMQAFADEGLDVAETRNRVLDYFSREVANPTDTPRRMVVGADGRLMSLDGAETGEA
jgi:hypothetical protein